MTSGSILVGDTPPHQRGDADGGAPAPGKPPLVALTGPTAVGKTSLALSLAEHLPVEIVNADSRAFYRGMDIGTAKPSVAERTMVPHHLIDLLDPDEPMSLATFQALARDAIGGIHRRRRLPLLVGGTPQYVNALVEAWNIPNVPPDPDFRASLEAEAATSGVVPLLERLREVDPVAAAKTGPNLRRIVRALEVHRATGQPISRLQTRGDPPYDALEFELWLPRDILHARIDRRVEDQLRQGLVDEVRHLLALGYSPGLPAFSSIGYRQLVPAITGEGDLDAAVERVKLDTHRLVRHQQTWGRRNPRLRRVDMTEPGARALVLDTIRMRFDGYLRGTDPGPQG